MIPVPHPALRRLYALGSVPGQFLAALASGQPALDALSRELDGLPLLSDAALEALVRGLDLSPLGALLDQALPQQPVQADSVVGGGGRTAVHPGVPTALGEGRVPGAHRPESALRPTGKFEPTPRPAPPPPRPGQVEVLLDRYAPEAGGPPSGASPDRPGRIPRSDGDRESPRPHRGPGNPDRGFDDVGTTGEETAHRQARGGPNRRSDRAARPDGGSDHRARQGGPRRDARQRIQRVDPAADASGALLRRAMRAGSPEAATTPVGAIPAPPEIDALLTETVPEVQRTGVPSGGRPRAEAGVRAEADVRTDRQAGAPPSGLSQVAKAIARLERRRPRPARPSPEAQLSPTDESDPASFAGLAAPDRSAPVAPPAAPRGLRGLVQRLSSPDSTHAFPDGPGPLPIPREGVPDLLVERMEDAMLADRIAAVLRREAARQGIDLEGAD